MVHAVEIAAIFGAFGVFSDTRKALKEQCDRTHLSFAVRDSPNDEIVCVVSMLHLFGTPKNGCEGWVPPGTFCHTFLGQKLVFNLS